MDIYVFDKNFVLQGIIDNYTSLIWVREYYGIGTMELHTLIDSNSLNILRKGNILVKEDDLTEAMYIDTIRMDYEHSETMIVSGLSIDNMIEDRIVIGTQTYSGSIEEVMRGFINKNAISEAKRKIPNLILGPINGVKDSAMEVNSWSYLASLMKELALKYDVGWRIIYDRTNKKYVFDVYRGGDYSVGQSINPRLIFSSEYENIFNQTYTDSDATLKTMALVAGDGEDYNRQTVVINDNLTGFNRKELFVDARDISRKDDNGFDIPQSTYLSLLNERGRSKLAESTTIRTFESGVTILSNLKYREDFNLGDKVTVQNERWGLVISTRITSIEEVYENNTTDIRVNFGSIIPTIVDKINKAVK